MQEGCNGANLRLNCSTPLNHPTSRFSDDQYEQLLASLGQLQRFDVWLESTLVANAWLPDDNEKALSKNQFPIDSHAPTMQDQILANELCGAARATRL